VTPHGADGAYADSEPSLGDLFGDLGRDLSMLLRKEVELAKVEAREEARRLTSAATAGVVAAVAALLALILLSTALAWWIAEALNTAVAFAIVGLLWVLVAAIGATMARKKIGEVQPLPETADAIKGAVTGERADEKSFNTSTDTRVLSPTHQISDTRQPQKETAS
jgi:uncharacterized membrane protein YqjE